MGILLAVGLLSRIAAFALTFDMIVAYITADRVALLSFFSDPGKFYNADPYTFLFAALLILIFWTRKAFCGYLGGALRQEAESL